MYSHVHGGGSSKVRSPSSIAYRLRPGAHINADTSTPTSTFTQRRQPRVPTTIKTTHPTNYVHHAKILANASALPNLILLNFSVAFFCFSTTAECTPFPSTAADPPVV